MGDSSQVQNILAYLVTVGEKKRKGGAAYGSAPLGRNGRDSNLLQFCGVMQPGGDGFRMRKPFLRTEGASFHLLNRGKKSLKVDLRDPSGKEIFLRLAREKLDQKNVYAVNPSFDR